MANEAIDCHDDVAKDISGNAGVGERDLEGGRRGSGEVAKREIGERQLGKRREGEVREREARKTRKGERKLGREWAKRTKNIAEKAFDRIYNLANDASRDTNASESRLELTSR